MNKWLIMILATIIAVLSGSQPSLAKLASPKEMPYVTLLDKFTLYSSSQTKANEVIGALSALQSVQLATIDRNELMNITSMDKLPLKTWLGTAWINLKEGAYKLGKLEYKDQTLNLLDERTPIFNAPLKETKYQLAPQKVQAIASIIACDPYTPCRDNNIWFLIHTTWLGDKWIMPYQYAEKYKAEPVAGMIPISQESDVYMHPFGKPLTDEPKVKPQVMKPIAKYTESNGMAGPTVWYQINTSKGIRWILLNSVYFLGVEGVEQVNISIDLPVAFHYYEKPSSSSLESFEEQPPQSVQAIGKRSDWYFVINDDIGKWVNPSKEIASRLTGDIQSDSKLGVEMSSAQLELTETSIALDTPYLDTVMVGKDALSFSSQKVTASLVWTSPNGELWYYIHTWKGPKWVRI